MGDTFKVGCGPNGTMLGPHPYVLVWFVWFPGF